MSVTSFKDFAISKSEVSDSGEHIYVARLNSEEPSFIQIACDVEPPIDHLVNTSLHSNEWGRMAVHGTSSGGMETTLLYNPVDGSAVVSNIYTARSETKGWGVSFQSMYRCTLEPPMEPLSLCGKGPNQQPKPTP